MKFNLIMENIVDTSKSGIFTFVPNNIAYVIVCALAIINSAIAVYVIVEYIIKKLKYRKI